MKISRIIWGIALIAFGFLLLVNKISGSTILSMGNMWPIFILLPGLAFEINYFSTKKEPGVLVPGGILTTIGLLFFFETYTNWTFSQYTWPIYILSVPIGLFQLYLFGRRHRALLIPVLVLTTVAVVSLLSVLFSSVLSWLDYGLVIPLLLIILGVYILLKNRK